MGFLVARIGLYHAPMSDDTRDDNPFTARIRRCPVCGEWFQAAGRGRYCSQACRQQAYRLRQERTREMQMEAWMQQLERRSALLLQTVYECPGCEQRFLLTRRCPDCNLMCRKLGLGGNCPHCDEIALVTELIGTDAAEAVSQPSR